MSSPISSEYQIVLAATTNAAASNPFGISGNLSQVTIVCNGLATDETATLYIYEPISKSYVEYLPTQQCTATQNVISLPTTHGSFEMHKSVSAAAVGISVCGSPSAVVGGAM